jgi:CubicO group peptidase (beta-lactamase class C family)
MRSRNHTNNPLSTLTGLLISITLVGGCNDVAVDAGNDDPGADLVGEFEAIRQEFGLPGLVVGYRQGRHPTRFYVGGIRRIGTADPLQVDDPMHIGSISKSVSATAIGSLVEHQLIGWDTRVFEVFPEFRGTANIAYADITLDDLLRHEAQILPLEEDEELAMVPKLHGSPTHQRYLFTKWALSLPPTPPPQDDLPYSNAGYAIAAAVAERVAQKPFEQLVEDSVFNPLSLSSAGFGWPARHNSAAPWGHRKRNGVFEPHDPNDDYQGGPLLAAAGDIHMSIPDLMKFAEAHLAVLEGNESGVFSTPVIKRLHETQTGYAGGWYVRWYGHMHTGSLDTFFAQILISPARDAAIVFATNGEDNDRDFELAGRITSLFYRVYDIKDIRDEAP